MSLGFVCNTLREAMPHPWPCCGLAIRKADSVIRLSSCLPRVSIPVPGSDPLWPYFGTCSTRTCEEILLLAPFLALFALARECGVAWSRVIEWMDPEDLAGFGV